MNLTTHLHLALRLRIKNPTYLLPYMLHYLPTDTFNFAYANIPLKNANS